MQSLKAYARTLLDKASAKWKNDEAEQEIIALGLRPYPTPSTWAGKIQVGMELRNLYGFRTEIRHQFVLMLLSGKFGVYNPADPKDWKTWEGDLIWNYGAVCDICREHALPLEYHHLNDFERFPSQRWDYRNGVVLCQTHHEGFHTWKNDPEMRCTKEDYEKYKKLVGRKMVDNWNYVPGFENSETTETHPNTG